METPLSELSTYDLKIAFIEGRQGAYEELLARGFVLDQEEVNSGPIGCPRNELPCPDCDGSLEARLREHAATLAAKDDEATVYTQELLQEAAGHVEALKKDAIRYRYLRTEEGNCTAREDYSTPEEFDASVDWSIERLRSNA